MQTGMAVGVLPVVCSEQSEGWAGCELFSGIRHAGDGCTRNIARQFLVQPPYVWV